MSKFISVAFIATALILTATEYPSTTLAGTCASKCGSHPIEFKPGQLIRVEVVNSTPNLVKFEKPYDTGSLSLQPGQKLQLKQGDGTEPNVSLVFWNEAGLSLKAIVSQPNFATLRVELRPNWQTPGHRSVYIRDDGRVNVF
ncbi:hypothetical protein [Mastigocladopsis repens]|uniref:hypothetical protein n=1 Tax=Mastigocladopsis repens TaxID=221287 RepID=UPI00035CE5CC|nr:hypothetical protein [Mastigocladopsis repens]